METKTSKLDVIKTGAEVVRVKNCVTKRCSLCFLEIVLFMFHHLTYFRTLLNKPNEGS